MLKNLRLPSLVTILLFFSAMLAQADEPLLDGVRPFICDGEAIVFLETDDGWTSSAGVNAEVRRTGSGWRFEDISSGDVWFLREVERRSWVINGVSEDGHFKVDCIDLADSISQIVTIIKPRLDEGILSTESQLATALQQIQVNKGKLIRAQTIISESQSLPSEEQYMLAIQRVDRLCIWMKTYRHLDVLDKSFPFGGQQYKLCK